jgi:phosphoglycolate phosphatase-like HAD superfamily hydrolase
VLVDLDGVLADVRHRLHHVRGPGRKNWPAFFAACGRDPLVPEGAAFVAALSDELAVVILTARPTSTHADTVEWLGGQGVRWDLLAMRPDGDYRPAPQVKGDAIAAIAAIGLDAVLALEDDDRNAHVFRTAGIPTLLLAGAGFGD